MSVRPQTMDDWRQSIAATIARLQSLTVEQFFNEDTLRYDQDCSALRWLPGAFELDLEGWRHFLDTTSPARGRWLPHNPSEFDEMKSAEVYYRMLENITGERWVDGALVDAFESGSLIKALQRLLDSLDTFELANR